MRWDIFCRLIDNHGDIGVCWRLACALAAHGHDTVRLWADDASALVWMAPQGQPGVELVPWDDSGAMRATAAHAPDVLIEAFGCDPAPELIASFARQSGAPGTNRSWINLEYLSAEPYVERLHGLPSPVAAGPGAGLVKHFFYPGFSPATGGLLRESDLPARRARFDRAAWLAQRGIGWHTGERLLSLFCYEPPALGELLAQLQAAPQRTHLLVTAGRASAALPPGPDRRGNLTVHRLPLLTQTDFDHLLWACDLNFVRGEDSLVRALWAGAPFVWQIYPQDDGAQHAKLDAFLDWLDAPPALRAFHARWNGSAGDRLPPLDEPTLAGWRSATRRALARLMAQDDLVTQLRRFVARKG